MLHKSRESLQVIVNWFIPIDSTYIIRVFRAYKSPHQLSLFVTNKIVLQKVTYQTTTRHTRTLVKAKKNLVEASSSRCERSRDNMNNFIKCDNKIMIKLAKNILYDARSKFTETHYHFVKENMHSKEIDLVYSYTNENVAAIFTQPLGKEKNEICMNWLGVV